MMPTITSCLAIDFVLAAATFKVELQGAASTHTVSVAAGTYRIGLAPSASDLLQVVQAALNAPAPPLPGGVSFAVEWLTDGRVAITCTGDLWRSNAITKLPNSTVGKALGYVVGAVTAYAARHTTTVAPQYVAYIVSASGGVWIPHQHGGSDTTVAGRVYGFRSSVWAFDRTIKVRFVPYSPLVATTQGTYATPWQPDPEYLSSVGDVATARGWAWLDLLRWAGNAQCGLALSNFQTLLTSTTERYHVGYLRPEILESPRVAEDDQTWPVYCSLDMPFVLQATGNSGTRA